MAAKVPALQRQRRELAQFCAKTFTRVGAELHVVGHVLGSDRVQGASPFGHGSDETVAVSLLFRISGQLTAASTDLFTQGKHYAAAALLRQIVEVEYLAWAIATKNRDAARWLRSDRKERELFFSPRRLREDAMGRFRGKDYGYHCELGGHPVPIGNILLNEDPSVPELLLSDMLGHLGHIWDHFAVWARDSSSGSLILDKSPEIAARFADWQSKDPLVKLPPPH